MFWTREEAQREVFDWIEVFTHPYYDRLDEIQDPKQRKAASDAIEDLSDYQLVQLILDFGHYHHGHLAVYNVEAER